MTEWMGRVARGIGWGPCRAVGRERMWILLVSIRLAAGALHSLCTFDPTSADLGAVRGAVSPPPNTPSLPRAGLCAGLTWAGTCLHWGRGAGKQRGPDKLPNIHLLE